MFAAPMAAATARSCIPPSIALINILGSPAQREATNDLSTIIIVARNFKPYCTSSARYVSRLGSLVIVAVPPHSSMTNLAHSSAEFGWVQSRKLRCGGKQFARGIRIVRKRL